MARFLLLFLLSFGVFSCNQLATNEIPHDPDALKFSDFIDHFDSKEYKKAFISQTPVDVEDSLIMVSGTVLNKKLKSLRLLEMKVEDKGRAVKIPIDENGTFASEILLKEDGFYQLEIGNKKLDIYLVPGNDLSFSYDHDNKNEPLKFDDFPSLFNTYIRQDIKMNKSLMPSAYALNGLAFEKFTDTLNYILTKRDNLLANLMVLNPGLPEGFQTFRKAEIDYSIAQVQLNRLKKDHKKLSEFGEIELNNEEALVSPAYRKFISSWFDYHIKSNSLAVVAGDALAGYVIAEKYTKIYSQVNKVFDNDAIAGYLKTQVIKDLIKETGTPAVNDLVMRFRKEVEAENYLAVVQKQYGKYVMVDDGALAPEFETVDLEGNKVKLSDFRGKYVYIDVWANWCSPCKHELPFFEQLKEEFKTSNIKFVSISIDKTQKIWKKAVAENNMKGIQLYAKGEWNSEVIQKYEMKGLPQFVLIDPKGQIVNLMARRPSGSVRNDLAMLP